MNAFVSLEEFCAYRADQTDNPTTTKDGKLSAALRKASLMALHATRGSVYRTDGHGVPTEPAVLQAFKLAVMVQVFFWEEHGLINFSGTTNNAAEVAQLIKSKSFGGTTIQYENAQSALVSFGEAQKVKSLVELVPEALLELESVGLLQPRSQACYTIGGVSFTPDLPTFVTKKQLETAISAIKPIDLSKLATKEELQKAIAGIDLAPYLTAEDLPDLSSYALKSELPEAPDLSSYATHSEVGKVAEALRTEEAARKVADGATETELGNLRKAIEGVLAEGATDAELAKAIADLNVAQFETIQHAKDTYAQKAHQHEQSEVAGLPAVLEAKLDKSTQAVDGSVIQAQGGRWVAGNRLSTEGEKILTDFINAIPKPNNRLIYTLGTTATGTANSNSRMLSNSEWFCAPVVIDARVSVLSMSLQVQAAVSTSTTPGKICVFRAGSDGLPDPSSQFPTIYEFDYTNIGMKKSQVAVPLVLEPGFYWIGVLGGGSITGKISPPLFTENSLYSTKYPRDLAGRINEVVKVDNIGRATLIIDSSVGYNSPHVILEVSNA